MKKAVNALIALVILFCTVSACHGETISESQEIQIGQGGAAKLEAQYGIVQDHPRLGKIRDIGQRIVNTTERRNLRFTFKVLNTDKVNALAFPGGFIYVTKGLLPHVDDQELAFVLAHEIAHVVKRHSIKQIEKTMWTNAGLVTIIALVNKGQVSQGSLNTVNAISTVIGNSYSREDETEADITACRYMVYSIGTNPRAGIRFMKKLQKMGSSEMPGFLNSLIGDHPLTEERIKIMEQECTSLHY